MLIDSVDIEPHEQRLGNVTFVIPQVPKDFEDAYGNIHRGALMTYLDISTTCALFGFDKEGRRQISRHIDVVFTDGLKVEKNSPLMIEASVLKWDDKIAYMQGKLYVKPEGAKVEKVIAFGNHVKTFDDKEHVFDVKK